jgi:lysine-N-methylase
LARDEQAPTDMTPRYMAQFQCVGGACVETCCADFHIDVDEPTYARYAAVEDPVLGDRLRALVRPRGAECSAEAFARIAMTPSGECPFLDEHRLCAIQGALGEAALSQTCRAFPRARWERGGVAWLGGKLSCPEAARLCLASADAMTFPAGEAPAPSTLGQAVQAQVEAALRDPALPVWKAVVFAGRLADRVLPDGVAEAPAGKAERGAVRDQAERTRGELLQAPLALGDRALVQLRLLIDVVLAASARCNAGRNRFPHLAQAALGAIFDGVEDFDGALANYRRLHRERFQPFDQAHDHALRNYVLNYVFTNQTFASGPALPQFQNLAVRFGVMRLLLIGLSGVRPQGLSLADYAAVVSAASRILDHDAALSPHICAVLDAVEPRSVALAEQMAIQPA